MRKTKNPVLASRLNGESRLQQAQRLGIPETTLRRYERGMPRRPGAAAKVHMAALGIAVDQ